METSPVSGNPSALYDPVALSERMASRNKEISMALEQQAQEFQQDLNQLLFLISGGRSYRPSSPDRRGMLVDFQQ